MTNYLKFYRKAKDIKKRMGFHAQETQHFALLISLETNIFKTPNKIFNKKMNSRISIRNSCVISGRSKSVVSKLKLSRLSFRKLVLFGLIPGIRKACW